MFRMLASDHSLASAQTHQIAHGHCRQQEVPVENFCKLRCVSVTSVFDLSLTRLRTATAGEGRSYCCEALCTPPVSGVRRSPVVLIGLPLLPPPSRPRAAADTAAACSDSGESGAWLTASPGMPAT